MTASNPITAILSAPLSPDWTIEGLAEQLLDAIAEQCTDETQELVLDEATLTDRQARRLLRPLLACLATKSTTECNLYGGRVYFWRSGPKGPVWISGQLENRPEKARVTLRWCRSHPSTAEAVAALYDFNVPVGVKGAAQE